MRTRTEKEYQLQLATALGAARDLLAVESAFELAIAHLEGMALALVERSTEKILVGGGPLNRVLGYPDNMRGVTLTAAVPRERVAFVLAYYARVFDGETVVIEYTVQEHVLIVRGIPIRNDAHEITHALMMARDVTDDRARMEQLARRADYDKLTGLPNEDFFIRCLNEKTADAQFGILMIDLDHFKRVNDEQGHTAGDACLREVALALQDAVRSVDLAVRLHGDEFAVLLKGNDREVAILIGRRIIAAIERLGFGVSASIGMATHPQDGTAMIVKEAADQALYRAKRSGRSRVC